jgi:YegS/Rv2252/BmrU family lipid kinase
MNRHVVIISNPIAGRGAATKLTNDFADLLRRRGHFVEVVFTSHKGEAQMRAGQLPSSTDALIIAGGDGTINEAINGLKRPDSIPLGFLPAGTANMLARELCVPSDPEAVADMIGQYKVRNFDMGVANGRRFLLLLSAGIDAMVAEEVCRNRNHILGYRGYFVPILKVLAKYRPIELTITVDGKTMEGSLALVLNVGHYGGIFDVSESARPDSGFLEVWIFRRGAIPDMLRYGAAALAGALTLMPDVYCVSGRTIRIESEEAAPVETDGDYLCATPVDVTIMPGSVSLLVP